MTNPDRSELVKLADELIAQNYGNVRDIDTMGEHFALLAKAASALRHLASSDSGVKGEAEQCAHDFALFPVGSDGRMLARVDNAKNYPAGMFCRWCHQPAGVGTAPPADAGMREALEEARERLLNIWAGRCPGVGCENDPVAFRDWATAYADAGVKSLDKALTAPGATTKSDGGCMADFSPDDPTNLKELMASKPVWSDPSSTRSDVTALADIANERQRQRDIEGWTVAHDDGHDAGEMASAAACYALSATGLRGDDGAMLRFWPWDDHWWKPSNRRRDLIKAGALIVAEIERLDRLDQFEIRRK